MVLSYAASPVNGQALQMNVPALVPLSDLSQEVQLRREAAKQALSHWSQPRIAPVARVGLSVWLRLQL